MSKTLQPAIVEGAEIIKHTYVERHKFFITWKEIVSSESLGNELYITTERSLSAIYINGKKVDDNPS